MLLQKLNLHAVKLSTKDLAWSLLHQGAWQKIASDDRFVLYVVYDFMLVEA